MHRLGCGAGRHIGVYLLRSLVMGASGEQSRGTWLSEYSLDFNVIFNRHTIERDEFGREYPEASFHRLDLPHSQPPHHFR